MRVAIVNEAPYHLEIVAGFLHVLSQLPVDVTWYQAGQSVPAFSAVDLLEMVGFNQLLGFMPRMRPTTDKPEPADFAIFVSPEYFERETKVGLMCHEASSWRVLQQGGVELQVDSEGRVAAGLVSWSKLQQGGQQLVQWQQQRS